MAATRRPWVEKYRPRRWDEMVGHDETVRRLSAFAAGGNVPHLLLAGPPGVGKTTAALCLAEELLGPRRREALLELNASNERGIDAVRNKIKSFARRKVTLPPGRHKMVLLDEADSMTEGAQQALRRTVELYSDTTRFVLACNNSDRIAEALQSRCATLRFSRLPDDRILAKALEVCEREGVTHTDDGLGAVAFTAQGDMRQALNNLQSAADGFGAVTQETVFRVCDEPHPLLVRDALRDCARGDARRALAALRELRRLGHAPEDVIGNVFRACKDLDVDEPLRLAFVRETGLTHVRIADGCDSPLQMSGLLARLCRVALDR